MPLINASGLKDKKYVKSVIADAADIEMKARQEEEKILEMVNGKIKL